MELTEADYQLVVQNDRLQRRLDAERATSAALRQELDRLTAILGDLAGHLVAVGR